MAVTVPSDIEALLYPVEDDMGEHELQTLILEVLRPLVERLLRSRGVTAHVGSDQFIYWRRWEPRYCLAPDLYVLFGVPQEEVIASWKVWETNVVPRFALEVVTDDRTKDYVHNVRAYDELGVEELLVFDPFEGRNRIPFQVFRRSGAPDGALALEVASEGDRVRSDVLDAWFVRQGEGGATRLRLGIGEGGRTLVPTDAERASAEEARTRALEERARAEEERARTEEERARTEEERARTEAERADAAEARAEALEAKIRALEASREGGD